MLVGIESYSYVPKKLDLDLNNYETPLAKPSTEDLPFMELKAFSSHLKYTFLGSNNTLSIIIIVDLLEWKVEALVSIWGGSIRQLVGPLLTLLRDSLIFAHTKSVTTRTGA